MAVKTLITNQGLQLLADSSYASGQYYWIGYYALAYVPDFWKPTNSTTIDFPTNNCGQVNTGTPIQPTDTDIINPTMTRLTTYGDMIWNIWQGDLNGTGYFDGPATGLFDLTAYNVNVSKHYRYILDQNGNNLLVAWKKNPNSPEGKMIGAMVYYGTDGYMQSEMPIPAPLYYLGDVCGKTSTQSFFDSTPTFEQTFGPYGNGSDIYPYITVTLEDASSLTVPKVSVDYRGYLDYNNGTGGWTSPSPIFNQQEIAPADPVYSGNVTAWYCADSIVETESGGDGICKEFWEIHTISNYNRWHAPANNIGQVIDDDLAARNMSKITKFFPISNYKVITTQRGLTIDGQEVEVATSLSLQINLNLTPPTSAPGYNETGYFDENGNLGYFNLYSCDPNVDPNCTVSPINDTNGQPAYNTTHVAFKFNRIGLYAVPILKAPYSIGDGEISNLTCNDLRLQYQINPDVEPVLFAVVDWDNTVTLDNTGDGIYEFLAEINLNLASPNGVDCSIIRDSVIFYNMYEDDAQTWYQNQLVATASTQNAITEIGLEVGALMQQAINNGSNCCPPPDLSELYASKNHTHDSLRNLLDAQNKLDGGLRGVDTLGNNQPLNSIPYVMGLDSVALGNGTASAGDYSTVAGGSNNSIFNSSSNDFIGAGLGNTIDINVSYSSILNGSSNTISGNPTSTSGSLIGSGVSNLISYGVIGGIIGGGDRNAIAQNSQWSTILNGQLNSITATDNSAILSGINGIMFNVRTSGIVTGNANTIETTANSAILSGFNNVVTATGYASAIGAGSYNYISIGENYIDGGAFIAGGSSNKVLPKSVDAYEYPSDRSSIIAGNNNIIYGSRDSHITSGANNIVDVSPVSSIFTGNSNLITSSTASCIVGGDANIIDTCVYSHISSGMGNTILYNSTTAINYSTYQLGQLNNIQGGYYNFIESSYIASISNGYESGILNSINSVIVNGVSEFITGSNKSVILTGEASSIISSTDSIILGGYDNTVTDSTQSSIINGYINYISATNASILNGGNNTTRADYSTIINGVGAEATYLGEVVHNAVTAIYPQQPNHSVVMYHFYSDNEAYLNTANAQFTVVGPPSATYTYNYISIGIDNNASSTTDNTDGNLVSLTGDFIELANGETFGADAMIDVYMEFSFGGDNYSGSFLTSSQILMDNTQVNSSSTLPFIVNINHTHTVSGPTTGDVTGIITPVLYATGNISNDGIVSIGDINPYLKINFEVFDGKFTIIPVFALQVDSITYTINKLQITAKIDGIYRKNT